MYSYSSLGLCPHSSFSSAAPTEMYTLSLHDALPISLADAAGECRGALAVEVAFQPVADRHGLEGDFKDRKSTRLNSSHTVTSYAVFCLKKKTQSPKVLVLYCLPGFAVALNSLATSAP